MIERSDKGKEARQYFIDCERIAQVQAAFPPADCTQVLTLLAQQDQLLMQYNGALYDNIHESRSVQTRRDDHTTPYQLFSLAFKESKKQWHYDRHGQPQANSWTIISEPCPEYQLKLFTYFIEFTPERKNVPAEVMKREWSHFKQWIHWLEACGVDCQAMQMPKWEQMEQVFKQIRERSQPANY